MTSKRRIARNLRILLTIVLLGGVMSCAQTDLSVVSPEHKQTYLLARSALETGDYPTAIQYYQEVIDGTEIEVLASLARLELGHAALRGQDPKKALEMAETLLSQPESSLGTSSGQVYILAAVAAHEVSRQADLEQDPIAYERLLKEAFLRLNFALTNFPHLDPEGVLIQRLTLLHNDRALYEIQKLKADPSSAQQRARYIQENYRQTPAWKENQDWILPLLE